MTVWRRLHCSSSRTIKPVPWTFLLSAKYTQKYRCHVMAAMKTARCHCRKCRECLLGVAPKRPKCNFHAAPMPAFRHLIDLVPRSVANCFIDALIQSEKRNGHLPYWTKSPERSPLLPTLPLPNPQTAKEKGNGHLSYWTKSPERSPLLPTLPLTNPQTAKGSICPSPSGGGSPKPATSSDSPQAPYYDNNNAPDATNHDTNNDADDSSAQLDVTTMSASEIWSAILVRRDLFGGMLTRSLLVAASSDASCLPLWSGALFMEKQVQPKRDQCKLFIEHFTAHHKLAWLRKKLLFIVASNRMYSKLRAVCNVA